MHAIDSPEILSSFDQGVQLLHIHRPEKKNALTRTMYRSLAAALHRADSDPAVRAILLHGEPDCFTSGNDVNDFLDAEDHTAERPAVQFLKAIAHARKPLVAAVNGLAVGIGTTLLLHCDLVYAAEEAWLQLPFTRLGLCPEAGASHLVPLLMGHQRAAELLLLGERFSAAKARDYGLVNEILPTDQVLPHALEKARALAALPAEAVQTSKHLLKRTQQSTIDDIMALELVNFSRLLRSPEATAIMQAFLQRRRD
jgi:enoyl-CoA hydratase/carnithine racemase